MDTNRAAVRREALRECGAPPGALDELLAYTESPFDPARLDSISLPLADEPHLDAWAEYEREARDRGIFPTLARRLVQLRFPIEEGISQTDAYRAATRRGVFPPGEEAGFALDSPERLELVLHPTLAGHVPVLTAGSRPDFVRLVRACSSRNEPERVPDSMGACIVNGLNNWDRVARYRQRLEADRGGPFDEAAWSEAFRGLVPQKPLYQDRFIILSREPYSAVPASAIGRDDAEWRALSVVIRREHECTHYFTLRAFGVMRNNLLDELIADFAGLAGAFGRYDAGLALRFLGLEDFPRYRAGGRFENYLGTPPLSAAAADTLKAVVVRAARNLEAFTAPMDLSTASASARLVVALAGLTLEELAGSDASALLRDRLLSAPGLA
jgi:hypothetical protein